MVVKSTQSVTRATTPRLPPLRKLRVKRPDEIGANPCLPIMSSVLSCWASSGFTTQGCAAVEQQLRACMDAPKPQQNKKSTINYHLSRLYPQMVGPQKRK